MDARWLSYQIIVTSKEMGVVKSAPRYQANDLKLLHSIRFRIAPHSLWNHVSHTLLPSIRQNPRSCRQYLEAFPLIAIRHPHIPTPSNVDALSNLISHWVSNPLLRCYIKPSILLTGGIHPKDLCLPKQAEVKRNHQTHSSAW